MSTKPLLCATALVALLVSSPAQAGISAFFGGLRATAALDTPAVCPLPTAEAIVLDGVLRQVEPLET